MSLGSVQMKFQFQFIPDRFSLSLGPRPVYEATSYLDSPFLAYATVDVAPLSMHAVRLRSSIAYVQFNSNHAAKIFFKLTQHYSSITAVAWGVAMFSSFP